MLTDVFFRLGPVVWSASLLHSSHHHMGVCRTFNACEEDTLYMPPHPTPRTVPFPVFISQALEFVTHTTAAVWYNNYPSIRAIFLLPSLSGILVCRKKPGEKQKHCWEGTLLENARTSRGQVLHPSGIRQCERSDSIPGTDREGRKEKRKKERKRDR